MKTKLFVAAAVLLAAVFCILLMWRDDPVATPGMAVKDPPTRSVPSSVEQSLAPAAEPTREGVPASAPRTPLTEAPLDPSPVHVQPWLARFLVLDEDDKPVADAIVTISVVPRERLERALQERLGKSIGYSTDHVGETLFELRTDATGRASATLDFECVAARAGKDGVKSGQKLLDHTRDGTGETKFVLAVPLWLHGRVVHGDGAPAAGAKVTARINGGDPPHFGRPPAPAPVLSDTEGRFAIQVAPHFGYDLNAALDGQKSFLEHRRVRSQTPPDVVLTLAGAIKLKGIVVDPDGDPVENARVIVRREFHRGDPKQPPPDEERAFARSGTDGRFMVDVRQHQRYQLLASADRHATSELVWAEPTAVRPHAEVRLVLQRFAPIGGVVRRGDGSPFAGVLVVARLEDREVGGASLSTRQDRFQDRDVPGKSTTSGLDGRFALSVHPGTDWTIVAWPVAGQPQFESVTKGVKPGSEDLSIVIRDEDLQSCVVRGDVVNTDAQPVTAFEVDLVSFGPDGKLRSYRAKIGIDGYHFTLPMPLGRTFAIDVFPIDAGKSGVEARLDGPFAPVRVGPFTSVSEGVKVNARVECWGELPMQVLASDGTPARGMSTSVRRDPDLMRGVVEAAQRLDAEGRRVMKRRVPGLHTVFVSSESGMQHQQEVVIRSGLNPELIVRLPPGFGR